MEARKEVLVAAGAVHTPQLLQLSGIGPKVLLNRFKIPIVSGLPGVGSYFQDHPSRYPVHIVQRLLPHDLG